MCLNLSLCFPYEIQVGPSERVYLAFISSKQYGEDIFYEIMKAICHVSASQEHLQTSVESCKEYKWCSSDLCSVELSKMHEKYNKNLLDSDGTPQHFYRVHHIKASHVWKNTAGPPPRWHQAIHFRKKNSVVPGPGMALLLYLLQAEEFCWFHKFLCMIHNVYKYIIDPPLLTNKPFIEQWAAHSNMNDCSYLPTSVLFCSHNSNSASQPNQTIKAVSSSVLAKRWLNLGKLRTAFRTSFFFHFRRTNAQF